MTIPELQALRDEVFGEAKEMLSTTGALTAWFVLVRRDGGRELIIVPGNEMNNRDAKTALAAFIRARVASGEIQGLCFCSDVFFTHDMPPAAEKIRRALGMDLEQAAAAGLCEKREAIMVQIESPLLIELTRQEYRREGKTIVFVGDPFTMSTTSGLIVEGSKLAGFFGAVHSQGTTTQ